MKILQILHVNLPWAIQKVCRSTKGRGRIEHTSEKVRLRSKDIEAKCDVTPILFIIKAPNY